LLITKSNKEESRKGKILIVNAVKEVKQEKNIAFLEDNHIEKIYKTYLDFKDKEGFCKVVSNEEVIEKKGSLNIAQYVSNVDGNAEKISIDDALVNWNKSSLELKKSMNELFQILN
jgi:type I restriction enzyme M protein